ncbi:efflux RND transporter periplasmic adaptor subunit [Novipirellula artificiosorum]|uniref:HlyD family secretion protein n=1 Tax=Novipirellula artificiosorum TaxID=2528016 RepID=A0A5C6DE78_9BACT|nr:biotin/lipoyl-binding protein [Novipirellula artificiosorum]TWU34958.1 HlyD family secretion protein [Novipirellula artificiosorum]
MNAASTDSIDTPNNGSASPTASADVNALVKSLAAKHTARSAFVQALATHLQRAFGVGLVAIDGADWNQPIMLVADETLGQSVHRNSIRQSLKLATVTPVACDLALIDPLVASGSQDPSPSETQAVRAYRVELAPSPDAVAVLLIHPVGDRPSPAQQLQTLRKLGLYVEPASQAISDFKRSECIVNDSAAAPVHVERGIPTRNHLLHLHQSLQVNATAYRIANESRRLIGCDRSTVLVIRGNKFRVRAVSGVAVIDRRSNAIRSIEKLVNRAVVMARPLRLPGEELLPPQIQSPLDEYLDECGVATAMMLPLFESTVDGAFDEAESLQADSLKRDSKMIGVVLAESFSGVPNQDVTQPMTMIAAESSVALSNAIEHESIFGVSLWKSLGRIKQVTKLSWLLFATAVATMMLIASMVIQVDHRIVATGSVSPLRRQQVFAPQDGVVKTLHVTDGQAVKAGQTLLELDNAELERTAENLTGQIQTTLQRLASIKAVRLSDGRQENQSSRMAVEQQQYENELANLEAQQGVLRIQQEGLVLKSPLNGTVVGWQLEQRLASRPVSRGNLLLSVVDESGPWELNLCVPDRDAGAMLDAIQYDSSLPITFAVATQPQRCYAAVLRRVASVARVDDTNRPVIDIDADVAPYPDGSHETDLFDPTDVRIGADVTARVYCGRRSLLASWFSDAIDFVDRNVVFYFR